MTEIDELYGQVRAISALVNAAIRTEPSDFSLAGWGQFLESNSAFVQIGPYGTAAGIVVNQIAYPDSRVEARVLAQFRAFWNSDPTDRFHRQNVRLAFSVLALGKAVQPEVTALRDEIAIELRNRQLEDGSWSDATAHTAGRPDATAWAVLALKRAGGSEAAVERGAKWLANRVEGSGRVQLLSLIGMAAAVVAHPEPTNVRGLRQMGFDLLEKHTVNREESISFFDYDDLQQGSPKQTRDYLCFPAFYPLSILINGLALNASFLQAIRLEAYRSDAVKKLIELSNGHTYQLSAGRSSATVDQAIYAISYEQLAAAQIFRPRGASLFTPLYRWSKKSPITQLFLPIVFVALAVVTVNDPTTVPLALRQLLGKRIDWLVTFATTFKPQIQIGTAILVSVMPTNLSKRLMFLREWFRKG